MSPFFYKEDFLSDELSESLSQSQSSEDDLFNVLETLEALSEVYKKLENKVSLIEEQVRALDWIIDKMEQRIANLRNEG